MQAKTHLELIFMFIQEATKTVYVTSFEIIWDKLKKSICAVM